MTKKKLQQLFSLPFDPPLLWQDYLLVPEIGLHLLRTATRASWPAPGEDSHEGAAYPADYEDHGGGRVSIRVGGLPVHGWMADLMLQAHADIEDPCVYDHRHNRLYGLDSEHAWRQLLLLDPVAGSQSGDSPAQKAPVTVTLRVQAQATEAYLSSLSPTELMELVEDLAHRARALNAGREPGPLTPFRALIEALDAPPGREAGVEDSCDIIDTDFLSELEQLVART
jgi:hypothetical protein